MVGVKDDQIERMREFCRIRNLGEPPVSDIYALNEWMLAAMGAILDEVRGGRVYEVRPFDKAAWAERFVPMDKFIEAFGAFAADPSTGLISRTAGL